MSRLAKLTDLFQEGRVAELTTPAGDTVVVWINKLSPFETEQCNHEGRIARARKMLAIREIGTPEYDLFKASAAASRPDAIIDALVSEKSNEHLVKAIRDLHSDPEWKPRLETLEWSSDQVKGKPDDDPEVQALAKVLREYQAELEERTTFSSTELREELKGLSLPDLREQYLESYVETRGIGAFTQEQQKAQIFYALRQCDATDHGDGTWTHENCDHSKRWLDDVREVDTMPQGLLEQVRAAYEDLNMAPDVARFSAALGSSSAPPEHSSKQEDSADSGPEATSVAPAGTSSRL